MRVNGLSQRLDIKDGDPSTHKKGSFKICNNQSGDQNYVRRNFKQTSKSVLFKYVAVFHWSKSKNFTVQPLRLVNFSIKKEICFYVKHLNIINVHKMWICELAKISNK